MFHLLLLCGPLQLRRYSYSLRTLWSGDLIRLRARFSAPVQASSGAHPTSCLMVTGSFPEVKRKLYGVNHPSLSSAVNKDRMALYLCFPSRPSWPVLGQNVPTLTSTFFLGARGGAVGWGTALQTGRSRDRFPMESLEFFSALILSVALWPWGRLNL